MTCQEALRKLFADPQTNLTRDTVYEALDKAYRPMVSIPML